MVIIIKNYETEVYGNTFDTELCVNIYCISILTKIFNLFKFFLLEHVLLEHVRPTISFRSHYLILRIDEDNVRI